MAYTGTTPKDIDTSTPNGATEYVSILDDAIKEAKTILKNQYAVATKAANYPLVAGDSIIMVNGTYTMTLPTASSVASSTYTKHYWIFNVGSGTATIARNGANINGAASDLTVATQYAGYHLWTNGTDWWATYISSTGADLSTVVLKAGSTMTGDLTMSGASVIEAEGAAVASAGTTNIWATDGNTVHITGTTTITSFGTAPQAGAWMKVIFDGALTLTHGANLNLPGSANITTAADDFAFVYADTTTQFDVIYFKKDGTAVVSSGGDMSYSNSRFKVGTFTKTTGTGTQAITGVGFTPKAVVFLGDFGAADQKTWTVGFTDGTGTYAQADSMYYANYADASTTACIYFKTSANSSIASISSLDADGFTMNWTTNTITDTKTISYIAFR